MKNRSLWLLFLAMFVVSAFLATSRAQEKPTHPVAKWEYKVLSQSDLDKAKGLGQVGDEGWELAAVEGETREPQRVADFKFGGTIRSLA